MTPFGEPRARLCLEEIIGEILAPDGGVFDAGLGERAVEIEHADQAGPGAGPIGDGEDGAAVADQAGNTWWLSIARRFGDDERGARDRYWRRLPCLPFATG
jgi:hypothetical protein